MADGIYAAAAGMAAQQTRLDAIASDLANSDTPGYKSERIGFKDLVYNSEDGVAVGAGAAAVDAGRSLAQGTLNADASNPLSVALTGPGFIQIRRPDGTTGLTRDGDLQLDSAGSLVTTDGSQLVPPIKVPVGTQPKDITIAGNGTVNVGNRAVGKISIVNVPAPGGLLSVGSSTYLATTASGAPAPVTGTVTTLQQGQLEASDVDAAEAMTDMMDAQQSYSLASRAISMQDQMLQIANEIKS
jgi:flagellar basal-body rod protein FlgG